MKFVKELVAYAAALLMFTATAFAEETTYSTFKATIDGDNISVTEAELTGSVDNSNLQVEVIEQVGEQSTVIYTGVLGGYDNGTWVNIDFSCIDFLMILDWDGNENEAIYIKPMVSETERISTEPFSAEISPMYTNEITSYRTLENVDNALNTDIKIAYNNEYYEGVLKQNDTINVSLSISNSGSAKELVCYLAEYDDAGCLLELTEGNGNTITVPAEGNITVNMLKNFSNPNTASAKIFLWEDGIIKPVINSLSLSHQGVDYYADTISQAQNYDIAKTINGRINTASDIDYIKFVPASSGQYLINTSSTVNVSGGLYDAQNNLIISGTPFNGGYYCKTELVSGNTYYLKTMGNTIGEYDITINETADGGFVEITDDSIKFTQSCNSASQMNVNLYSSGTLVQSVAATPSNGKLTAEFDVDDLQSEYKITVEESNMITAIYDVKTVMNNNIYDVTTKSYISVPMTVSNVSDLSDIYFSVAFDGNEFMIFDVCEHTYTTSETGTGLISSAEVNIKAIENNAVVFTSTKSLTETWSGNINTVKLQALDGGECTVKTIAYSVK